jgi:hypothetical protein
VCLSRGGLNAPGRLLHCSTRDGLQYARIHVSCGEARSHGDDRCHLSIELRTSSSRATELTAEGMSTIVPLRTEFFSTDSSPRIVLHSMYTLRAGTCVRESAGVNLIE